MTDVFTKEKRSDVMSRIRSSGNRATELKMIQLFRAYGVTGWRRNQTIRANRKGECVRIRPDFIFRRIRVAVFVDGKFWHGHPSRSRLPQTRRDWWKAKIDSNRRRDRMQNKALRECGWSVIRVWQYELSTPSCVRKLRRAGLVS